MKIEKVIVGELECNCYILDIDGSILIIDPGSDTNKIINKIKDRKVVGIVITHYHFDHIGALNDLVDKYNALVYDNNNMQEGKYKIDKFEFEIINTKGHKDDAITIYFRKEKIMFCGDFIFRGSIGRCDLPGGNINKMIESLNKIKKYNKEIVIYPGHGNSTILGYEIENNIYFRNTELL